MQQISLAPLTTYLIFDMKLSQLIRYQNMVNEMNTNDIKAVINGHYFHMMADLRSMKFSGLDFNPIMEAFCDSLGEVQKIEDALIDIKAAIQTRREELEKDAMMKTYEMYERHASDPNIADRILQLHENNNLVKDDILDDYRRRAALYTSWTTPGIMIRPLGGEVLDIMLPLDPLYLIDETADLLAPSRGFKKENYQRRLRYKVINEFNRPILTSVLPVGQFGFILANDFFTWKTLDVIHEYLREFWELLKPGGVAMFMFNNGDVPGAVENFEAGMYTYIPASILKPMVEAIGFHIIYEYNHSLNVSWLEIKKPGEFETLRGGQALGVIKSIDDPDA
jgi:SAM-dependent methyltransferase